MKLKIVLAFFLISLVSNSQISVGARHVGGKKSFSKGVLDKLKATETIFILSNVYDKDTYENLLKDTWTITPYKLISFEDFKIEDYLNDAYSFVELGGHIKIKEPKYGGGAITRLYTYIDFKMYDNTSIIEAKTKLSDKKWKKNKRKVFSSNTIKIARIYLFQKEDLITNAANFSVFDSYDNIRNEVKTSPEYVEKVINMLYNKDVFFNYKKGYLKNYFQKLNTLIDDEQTYWMYEEDYTPELKQLQTKKLYIPSYLTVKYNGFTIEDMPNTNAYIDELFNKYTFDYEVISDEELNDKIMQNEELYYLRYVRMNNERFIQIVNSKNGEIVYRNYLTGLSYNIKSKNIKQINDKIKKL